MRPAGVPDPDVVVVGGGVAGLVCARDLASGGLSVVVLEVAERVGGCVASVEVDGLVLDAGAESFATRSDAVRDLLTELGLGDDVVRPEAGAAWVHAGDGRSTPLPAGGLLGIPGRPWARDVVAAVGHLGAARASLDRVLPWREDGPMTVSELVRRRLGRRVLERLVRPVVAGVHSADPADLDADVVLPGLRERARAAGSLSRAVHTLRAREGQAASGAAVAGVRGGMHRLVTALVEDLARLGVEVRTGVRATGLERVDDGADAGLWVVGTDGGGEVSASRVVLAVPGPAARTLLAPHLPETGRTVGAQPDDTDVELVHLVLDAPALDARPRGTGVLVAPSASAAGGLRAKALTHATAKWAWLAEAAGPGRHVVRLSYGRAGEPPPGGTPEQVRDRAVADAGRLLGVALHPDDVRDWARTRWRAGLPQTTPGDRARLRALRDAVARVPGLDVTGAWVAGTGLVAVVGDARRTAAAVLDGLGQPPPTGSGK